ncbi:hypothetical protein [Mycoavidus sp. B2-EB]|uniref:hypothetical protein n=1 Tax=Mycoavidus sp. B2-EB TaxID=2651972 RepID=UPI0016237B7B|nr:hypothetical protein [Mycoavidus sp. B2-EB]
MVKFLTNLGQSSSGVRGVEEKGCSTSLTTPPAARISQALKRFCAYPKKIQQWANRFQLISINKTVGPGLHTQTKTRQSAPHNPIQFVLQKPETTRHDAASNTEDLNFEFKQPSTFKSKVAPFVGTLQTRPAFLRSKDGSRTDKKIAHCAAQIRLDAMLIKTAWLAHLSQLFQVKIDGRQVPALGDILHEIWPNEREDVGLPFAARTFLVEALAEGAQGDIELATQVLKQLKQKGILELDTDHFHQQDAKVTRAIWHTAQALSRAPEGLRALEKILPSHNALFAVKAGERNSAQVEGLQMQQRRAQALAIFLQTGDYLRTRHFKMSKESDVLAKSALSAAQKLWLEPHAEQAGLKRQEKNAYFSWCQGFLQDGRHTDLSRMRGRWHKMVGRWAQRVQKRKPKTAVSKIRNLLGKDKTPFKPMVKHLFDENQRSNQKTFSARLQETLSVLVQRMQSDNQVIFTDGANGGLDNAGLSMNQGVWSITPYLTALKGRHGLFKIGAQPAGGVLEFGAENQYKGGAGVATMAGLTIPGFLLGSGFDVSVSGQFSHFTGVSLQMPDRFASRPAQFKSADWRAEMAALTDFLVHEIARASQVELDESDLWDAFVDRFFDSNLSIAWRAVKSSGVNLSGSLFLSGRVDLGRAALPPRLSATSSVGISYDPFVQRHQQDHSGRLRNETFSIESGVSLSAALSAALANPDLSVNGEREQPLALSLPLNPLYSAGVEFFKAGVSTTYSMTRDESGYIPELMLREVTYSDLYKIKKMLLNTPEWQSTERGKKLDAFIAQQLASNQPHCALVERWQMEPLAVKQLDGLQALVNFLEVQLARASEQRVNVALQNQIDHYRQCATEILNDETHWLPSGLYSEQTVAHQQAQGFSWGLTAQRATCATGVGALRWDDATARMFRARIAQLSRAEPKLEPSLVLPRDLLTPFSALFKQGLDELSARQSNVHTDN